MKSDVVIYSDTLIEGDGLELYDGVTGETYNSYVWQGVRPYFKDYIFVGTATTSPYSTSGLVAIGDEALAFHSNVKTFAVKCLTNAEEGFTGPPLNTSIYGPNVVGKNIFNLVGTYNNIAQVGIPTNAKIYAFYYTGKLKFTKAELLNPNRFRTIPSYKMGLNITFAHSMSNNHIAINGGNLTSSTAQSYIYNVFTEEFTSISIPGYNSVTTYGILYNEPTASSNEVYTLVGGCSDREISLMNIYDITSNNGNATPVPYGSAFILQYNMTKKKIESIKIFQKNEIFIHFQGISFKSPNIYNVVADTLVVKSKKFVGSVKKIRYTGKTFKEEGNSPLAENLSANSIANNVVCGVYESSGDVVPYQATFKYE